MIDDYLDNITYLENCGEEEAGYINLFMDGWTGYPFGNG